MNFRPFIPLPFPQRKRLRVGYFGGTFNPPHNGHVALVEKAIESIYLDKVFVVPCGAPHDKEDRANAGDRMEMTKLAYEEVAKVEVVGWEVWKSSPAYTYDTLLEQVPKFHRENGHDRNVEWYLLMGGDQAHKFPRWKMSNAIHDLATPCYLSRDVLSSTSVRDAMSSGDWDKVSEMVPEKVYEYLKTL